MVAITLIQLIPLFSHLPADLLEAFASASNLKRFARAKVILQGNEAAQFLYVILSGRVKVFMQNEDGKEVVLAQLHRHHFFGEMGLIDNLSPSATVETLEPTELLLIPKSLFNQCLATNREFSAAMIGALIARLREADRKIESLALLGVYGRVARHLLDLSVEANGELEVSKPPSKQEMARHIGASREMVSRVMNHLKESGTVRLDGRKIILAKRPWPEDLK